MIFYYQKNDKKVLWKRIGFVIIVTTAGQRGAFFLHILRHCFGLAVESFYAYERSGFPK